MRVDSEKKKRRPQDLSLEEILLMAENCTYNYATRYLNVTLESFKKFVKTNYPEIHIKFMANRNKRTTVPYYTIKRIYKHDAKE